MNSAGHCPENSQRASGHVDDVAQSQTALYSFLLECTVLFNLLLKLRIRPDTCSINIKQLSLRMSPPHARST